MVMLPGFVDGPPARAQRGGLVANALPGDQSVDWLKGVQWWPEDVGGWQLAAECDPSTIDVGDVGFPRPVVAQPFLIRTNVKGPKSSLLDLGARAGRRLESITSQAVARELWLGELAQAAPFTLLGDQDWSNPAGGATDAFLSPYLTSGQATDVGVVGADPDTAIAAVEEALSEIVSGGPLYIHMPSSVVFQVGAQLTRQGDLLTTPAGSVIVADYGYPGDTGSGTTIYGTGPVMVWTGDARVYGDPSEYVRVSDNHIEVWADRPAMTIFDPLTLISCQVTV